MPVASATCCIANSLDSGEKGVCVGSVRLRKQGVQISKIRKGRPEQRDFTKKADVLKNGMADCFTLLRRITRLKCVNSDGKN